MCAPVVTELGSLFRQSTLPIRQLTGVNANRSGRITWFLRKAAASSLEHHLVCHIAPCGGVFWFATPRTPPLWQRDFFLVNCSVLRSLSASERSGVVKTFRRALAIRDSIVSHICRNRTIRWWRPIAFDASATGNTDRIRTC